MEPWLPLIGVLVGAITSILGGLIAESFKERSQVKAARRERRLAEATRFREAAGAMLTISATRRSQISALNQRTNDASQLAHVIDVVTQNKKPLSEDALAVYRSGAEFEAAYYQVSLSEIDVRKEAVELWNQHRIDVSSLGSVGHDVGKLQSAEYIFANAVRDRVSEYLAAKK